MTRGRLAVHAHFYQPSRVDPWTGLVLAEPAAAPFHDWNARVDAECYRPNAERGNLRHISFNVGPTLADWLDDEDPPTYRAFVEADSGAAIAQAFHHTILPLASAADRRTEIRWGLRDFEIRFGRQSAGLWLPETAVDLATLRILAESGVGYTILAPWQADQPHLDTRRPYRVDLGDGRSIVVAFYDAGLSTSVSFEPEATADADRFARERVLPRFGGFDDGEDGAAGPLALIATDGELYGHHQQFRDLFLQRLVTPSGDGSDRGFDVSHLATALEEPPDAPFATVAIVDRTSWSCHHGVARWSAECPDARDGRWKGPLRVALERLATAIDVTVEAGVADLPGSPDMWAARDAYVDVAIGQVAGAAFAAEWLPDGRTDDRRRLLDLLEAERWRLAMFASDGWFWDDPIRPETKQVLRSAARSVRLVDDLCATSLEQRLLADLAMLVSPGWGLDGAGIYREALAEVGQPAERQPRNPSARDLRVAG